MAGQLLTMDEVQSLLGLSRDELLRQIRLQNLMPRYRMGETFVYDTYDVKRFQDTYLNPSLVTVAEIARMLGLRRAYVQAKLAPYRDTVAVTSGNAQRRVGALYDLNKPIMKHLFAQWGWNIVLKEREADHDNQSESTTTERRTLAQTARIMPSTPASLVKRRNKSGLGKGAGRVA